MANALMMGLDDAIALELERIMTQAQHTVWRSASQTNFDSRPDADLVFISGGQKDYIAVIQAIRCFHNAPPIVVVTRLPDTVVWLDALEAGATDYCSAPFEALQIGWILDSVLSKPRTFAA